MTVRLLGYSERGMVNALCDDLAHSPGASVKSFLPWFDFPGPRPDFTGVRSTTLLVEQSFSDFGDLDLLVLLDHADGRRQAVFIEAKVSNDTRSWPTVEDRWAEFLGMFDGGEWNTSNLFVQLHRKVRLVESLSAPEGGFEADLFVPRGSTGQNSVVREAVKELMRYAADGNVWFGAILPDAPADLEAFARDTLPTDTVTQRLPKWDCLRWGFLSWRAIDDNTRRGWPQTRAAFEWNKNQIYQPDPPIRQAVQVGQVYLHGDAEVYVVQPGRSDGCRVAELSVGDRSYFWRTAKVALTDLRPCERPVHLTEVPALPLNGSTYTWDCRGAVGRLPPQRNPLAVEPGTAVTVVGASWYTSRVRKADDPDGPTFLVFTHHLKRPPV